MLAIAIGAAVFLAILGIARAIDDEENSRSAAGWLFAIGGFAAILFASTSGDVADRERFLTALIDERVQSVEPCRIESESEGRDQLEAELLRAIVCVNQNLVRSLELQVDVLEVEVGLVDAQIEFDGSSTTRDALLGVGTGAIAAACVLLVEVYAIVERRKPSTSASSEESSPGGSEVADDGS